MKPFSKKLQQPVSTSCTMETRNHFKNGASPKSQKMYLMVIYIGLIFGIGNMYAQSIKLKDVIKLGTDILDATSKGKDDNNANKGKNDNASQNSTTDTNSGKTTNQSSKKKVAPISSVITPWTIFTNTFVRDEGGGYYVISYTDGNLYHRVKNDSQLILENVKEITNTYLSWENSKSSKYSHFALKNDDSLWAWGDNSAGQLGDNTGINKTAPVKIMDNVRNISTVQKGSIFAVKNDGTVYAWGKNDAGVWQYGARKYGLLGVGNLENRYAPEKLPIENVLYAGSLNYKTEYGDKVTQGAITLSGDEYRWGEWYNGNNKFEYSDVPKLVGKHDYNVYLYEQNATTGKSIEYKLMSNGNLYKDNSLLASNVYFASAGYEGLYVYITKSGELYSWGKAPIGDGSNIPRKEPVLVLQNIIQFNADKRCALGSDGKLYMVDSKDTFKYEVIASDVYLINDFFRRTEYTPGYYTNDGVFMSIDGNLLLRDVALPQIKYELKP